MASDQTKSRQKLLSLMEVGIGDIPSKSTKSKSIYVISLIDGSIELKQVVRYQVVDSRSNSFIDTVDIENIAAQKNSKVESISNVTLEYIENAIHKSKKDTIIIPCVPEFTFFAQFFSLNRQPLNVVHKHEDFLFQVELQIKSTDIDILDMFLISVSIVTLCNRMHQENVRNTIFKHIFRTIILQRSHITSRRSLVGNTIDHIFEAKKFTMFYCCTPKVLALDGLIEKIIKKQSFFGNLYRKTNQVQQ